MFATKNFDAREFLLEYKGELLSLEEGERRESNYQHVPGVGSFLFFFTNNFGIPTW